MNDYEMEESNLDRLSELPQSLILHILSFLPIRDVISTTLLSKRWVNLWTTIPCLNFSYNVTEDDYPDSDSIRNFVNRALIFWEGTKLLKFIFNNQDYFDKSLTGDMNLWVRYAVKYKVEELSIRLADDTSEVIEREAAVMSSNEDVYTAPQCLNSCSSLRKLSLVGCNLRIQGPPAWDQLKSLRIDGFYLSERLIDQILLGAPRLEEFELRLVDSSENLNICSTSLKKLKIEKYVYFSDVRPSLDTVMRINCPNLETLRISDGFYSRCLFTNVSSLTDATLDFNDMKCYNAPGIKLSGEMTRHVFSTFQHVERLTLSNCSFQVLGAFQKKNLFSPLPNVVFLKLRVQFIDLVEMVHLLEIFPNLKMLAIYDCTFEDSPDINPANYLELETNLSKFFLLRLKIIDVTSNFNDSSIYQCIEFFLKHVGVLEKLVIRNRSPARYSYEHFLKVAGRLLSMSRPSPTTKVIFNIK